MDPPTLLTLFTPQVDVTSFFPALALVALVAYLRGVRALGRRGVRWPRHRTVAFTLGIVSVLLVTATQVMGYGMMLFSIHMLQKMVLAVLSSMLIMLGAPVSLAIRTLPRRGRGAVWRRLLVLVMRSRTAAVLAHPVVSTTLFVGSLYGFYFTPAFDLLMRHWAGSLLMLTFFLFTGLLAFGGAFGLDPWPHRVSAPMRLLELVVPGPLHAFFAVAVMMASTPLVQAFRHAPADWGVDVMTDQLAAGNIVWGFGELPTIIAVAIVFQQWVRSDERRARAGDRRAEVDLAAYNAELARLAEGQRRTVR
ncbi:cytochrome c oxidase assembly protein [Modestobacter italicus]|uniref:cytochrome c oxidase assembly protein n=1 Tax=Modestobacter italicus (strain DSM 44449 / CECT 9708 / BC 501) TaxID=2732864 RepID=UPI001E315687|nr:cytochrome c oxidase assembly protein [Modestobacter marinus]